MTKPQTPDPWRGERGRRGPRKFSFTYATYAALFGCSISRAKRMATTDRDRPPQYDPTDLQSVLALYLKRRGA